MAVSIHAFMELLMLPHLPRTIDLVSPKRSRDRLTSLETCSPGTKQVEVVNDEGETGSSALERRINCDWNVALVVSKVNSHQPYGVHHWSPLRVFDY